MRILSMALCLLIATMSAKAQNGHYVGGDISMLPQYEKSETKYLDTEGNVIPDLITWLKTECGWNTFRVRLFVNPKEEGTGITGVCQDIDYVTRLGKRIKDAGGKFLLDFHYSDSWADPVKQVLPAAWKDCTTAQAKAERIYEYTRQSLQTLKAAGATPDFIQIGNEISYGMVGIKVHPYDSSGDDWNGLLEAIGKGCKAAREICPDAKIIIHTERSGKATQTAYFYNKLSTTDYDIIGLSYYPFYHGLLTSLEATLINIKKQFPTKDVHIVETAYPIQWWPGDAKVDTRSTWPVAEGNCEGQHAFLNDLLATLAKYPHVDGLSWWFPEEAGNGDNANWTTNEGIVISAWLNRGMWWPTKDDKGHWPLKSSKGYIVKSMKDFLSPDATGIEGTIADNKTPEARENKIYSISGQYMGDSQKGLRSGLYIVNNKKIIVK